MSAVLSKDEFGPGDVLDISGTARVPFTRLVNVELRKMFDTRAGLWLGIITAGLIGLAMVLVLLVVGLNDDVTMGAQDWVGILTIPVSLLVPVLAIICVTSEWGQRTSLVTFTHEPHRLRVILAKLVTVIILAVGTLVVAAFFGAIGNLLYGAISGNEIVWTIDGSEFAWLLVAQILYFLMAFAIGMVFLSTPGSISVYYIVALLLPFMVYGTLYAIFGWARDVIPWLDMNYAMAPLQGNTESPDGSTISVTGTTYAQTAVTTLVWVVLPLAIGMWRVRRAEVK